MADELHLRRPGELGDVLMCLAVIAAIREKNPRARITFVTRYHEFLAGHPLLHRVVPDATTEATSLRNLIELRYEVFVPLRLHAIDYLAGCVGLREIPKRIPLPEFAHEREEIAAQVPHARPWIAVCRRAGCHTPNKDWPDPYWDQLIQRLETQATVIELGLAAGPHATGSRRVDLRGRTNLRQYCAAISLADLVVTPVTSSVHVAAAYGVPTVSILGGYELPATTAYPKHTPIARQLPCSPCWLTTPCPIDRLCLRTISVDEVLTAIRKQIQMFA